MGMLGFIGFVKKKKMKTYFKVYYEGDYFSTILAETKYEAIERSFAIISNLFADADRKKIITIKQT